MANVRIVAYCHENNRYWPGHIGGPLVIEREWRGTANLRRIFTLYNLRGNLLLHSLTSSTGCIQGLLKPTIAFHHHRHDVSSP
jgi:hypothetical protein